MGLQTLQKLLVRKNQRFRCISTSSSAKKYLVVKISHEIGKALSRNEVEKLEQDIGSQDQLFELYSNYGSARLYYDSVSGKSAFYIAPPSEWHLLEKDFQLWVNDLDAQEKTVLLPDWLDSAIVFGEIPESGNYFLYVVEGSHRGKVFEFDHDGFEFVEVGKDIFSFIKYVSSPTEKLIQNIGSHMRYIDGNTGMQWYPETHEYDE